MQSSINQVPMNGNEEDGLKAHELFIWRSGVRKQIKRSYNKRVRRNADRELRSWRRSNF